MVFSIKEILEQHAQKQNIINWSKCKMGKLLEIAVIKNIEETMYPQVGRLLRKREVAVMLMTAGHRATLVS